jgi:shikimate kinase
MHIVLLGLMGVGKTSVGTALSQHLGWPLSDSDAAIEGLTRQTGLEIQEAEGIRVLHGLEADHLLTALAAAEPSVVSAAASVIDNSRCRRALRGEAVLPIWLRASPATLATRFHNQGHRPQFGKIPDDFFRNQSRTRGPRFEEVDPVTFDVDDVDFDELVQSIIRCVDERVGDPTVRGPVSPERDP